MYVGIGVYLYAEIHMYYIYHQSNFPEDIYLLQQKEDSNFMGEKPGRSHVT